MIEKVEWCAEWAFVTNKYGRMLSYEMPYHNKQYEELYYQYPIKNLIESGNYDIFIDVGSYLGYFAIIASHYCKKVIAYEAHPFFYGVLLNNTKNLYNVECKYYWVSNKEDIPVITDILHQVENGSGKKYNIPVVTLDKELLHLKNEKILIKMDIEGTELKALKGSTEILKYPNIHWFIDVHTNIAGITIEDILAFFKGRDIVCLNNTLEIKGYE